jgi:hypothetical protein
LSRADALARDVASRHKLAVIGNEGQDHASFCCRGYD